MMMYRTIGNEKVELSRASKPEVTAKTGLAAISLFAKRVAKAVRQILERRAIERELGELDDRSLNDLGLHRGDIRFVALNASREPGEPTLGAAFSEMLQNAFVVPVKVWMHRRQAYNALMALDNRMLDDIGVSRYEIPEIVNTFVTTPEPSIIGETAAAVTAPFSIWNRARQTARELARLDDRMLLDIGVVRGDIDWVASEVARNAVYAANRNSPRGNRPHAA